MINNKAREFAVLKHAGQVYDGLSYVEGHLDKVADLVRKYFWAQEKEWPVYSFMVECAYLHDVLEDTATSIAELRELFDSFVVGVVKRVTDGPGKNRKERKLNSYWLIRDSKYATFLKLCDRLANVQSGGKLDMYKDEYYTFKCALWDPTDKLNAPLWAELDKCLL